MEILIDAEVVVRLHDQMVETWHQGAIEYDHLDPLMASVLENHSHNFRLWHEEDKARDPQATDGEVAQVKRNIDRFNQARNDAMEKIDEGILAQIEEEREKNPRRGGPLELMEEVEKPPLHSETVGSIVDRLSILSLKIYHMREETQRRDADEEHRSACRSRLAILREQRADLARALAVLAEELSQGKKRFKVYRQMKMYNDPALNPAIYRKAKAE